MGNARRAIALTLGLALVFAACGDDAAVETTAATVATTTTIAATTTTQAPTTTTTKAPTTTTTEPPGFTLPPTGVIGIVDMPYKWGDESGMPDEGELPFPLGTIEAHWYIAGDRYAVVFVGLDLEQTGPLCPGSSIFTNGAYAHVSNSPSPGASCEGTGAPVIGPPIGTQLCAGVVSYISEIPAGTPGTLYASIEHYPGTGTFYGASSVAEVDLDNMPEIDPAGLGC